jgi:hypothetical protein
MPGFIAGVGLGNLAGHAVVVWGLARRGVRIWRQDLAYSALVGAVAGAAIASAYASTGSLGSTPARLAIGAIGLAVSGWFALRECWPLIKPAAHRILARFSSTGHASADAAAGRAP